MSHCPIQSTRICLSVNLVGIIWSAKGHPITDTVRKQPLTFSAPAPWKQAKHLLDMLGFWRQNIPYLKISFKPTWCCYLQISSSWMGLHPTKDSAKQQVLPLASSRDPFTVEVLATSSQAFWSLWTTHDVQKLSVQKNTCFGVEKDYPCLILLGINCAIRQGSLYPLHSTMPLESCHPSSNLDVRNQRQDSTVRKISQTSGNRPSSRRYLANHRSHTYIFTDSWAIANGLAIWADQWQ